VTETGQLKSCSLVTLAEELLGESELFSKEATLLKMLLFSIYTYTTPAGLSFSLFLSLSPSLLLFIFER
jgi:hypothetical protein